MKPIQRTVIAVAELLLLFPAVLFFAALLARSIQPVQYEPAHTAELIVNWYAARPGLGLQVLLCALPLTVLVAGFAVLLSTWRHEASLQQAASQLFTIVRANLATLLIATATFAAGAILFVVAVHVAAD